MPYFRANVEGPSACCKRSLSSARPWQRPSPVRRDRRLENIIFSMDLAKQLQSTGATVDCVSPGPSRTRLGDNMTGLPGVFPRLAPGRTGPLTSMAKITVQVGAESVGAVVVGRMARVTPIRTSRLFTGRETAVHPRTLPRTGGHQRPTHAIFPFLIWCHSPTRTTAGAGAFVSNWKKIAASSPSAMMVFTFSPTVI
jgi:hypothetical protein